MHNSDVSDVFYFRTLERSGHDRWRITLTFYTVDTTLYCHINILSPIPHVLQINLQRDHTATPLSCCRDHVPRLVQPRTRIDHGTIHPLGKLV